MADKSKQHWKKAQERKKIKRQQEQAVFDSFIKAMDRIGLPLIRK